MSDIKLFRRNGGKVPEERPKGATVEKVLQNLVEAQPERCRGARLLESGQVADRNHGGRIDTLGIDEASAPAIIEYKHGINGNGIKHELFWLDWLMDHRDEGDVLVQRKPGSEDLVTFQPKGKLNRAVIRD